MPVRSEAQLLDAAPAHPRSATQQPEPAYTSDRTDPPPHRRVRAYASVRALASAASPRPADAPSTVRESQATCAASTIGESFAEFEQHHADRNVRRARRALILSLFVWFGFTIRDLLAVPGATGASLDIRLFGVASILGIIAVHASTRPGTFKRRMQSPLAIAAAALVVGMIPATWTAWFWQPPAMREYYWPLVCGISFVVPVFFGLRTRTAAMLTLLLLVAVSGTLYAAGSTLVDACPFIVQLNLLSGFGLLIAEHEEHRCRTRVGTRQRTARSGVRGIDGECEQPMARVTECRPPPYGGLALGVGERERFFSAAYHDLQQPLSIIGLYTRLAKSHLRLPDDNELAADLTAIERATHDIGNMCKGVRDVCVVGNRRPTIRPSSTAEFLNYIEAEFAPRARERNLRLVIRRSPHDIASRMASDAHLLQHALANLVRNAIKFTDRGTVLIAIVHYRNHIRIDVRDSGIGIAEEYHGRIFDDYFRIAQPERERNRGLGLGLSIVRRIIDALPGHRLSFASAAGRGSRFSLHVPLHAQPFSETSGALAVDRRAQRLAGRYLVIVDRSERIRESLGLWLAAAGAIVDRVESPGATRELFAKRDRSPDLLIIGGENTTDADVREVMRSIAEHFEWASATPVLALQHHSGTSALHRFPGGGLGHRADLSLDALSGESLIGSVERLTNREPGKVAETEAANGVGGVRSEPETAAPPPVH